jgi:hypothetical protein
MLDSFDALFGWLGVPRDRGKTHGIAFAIAAPIFGLFGVLFAAAGWHGIWASGWSYECVGALVMFVVGVLLVVLVTASVISFLRANGKAK